MNIENNLIIWCFKGKITQMISYVTLLFVLKECYNTFRESFLLIFMKPLASYFDDACVYI